MRVFNLFLVLFLLKSTLGLAQLKVQGQIKVLAKQCYADNLNQIYLLSNSDELLKYDSKGHLLQRYSNNRYGELSSIDVSNPMRILLFYKDFQQLVVLDNQLSELSTYSFATNTDRQIVALASDNMGQLWVFDSQLQQLILLNQQFKEILKSGNLSELDEEPLSVTKVMANDNYVLLQTGATHFKIFDRFAAYYKKLDLSGTSNFSLLGNKLFYINNGQLGNYNLQNDEEKSEQLASYGKIKGMAMTNKIVVLLTEKAVLLLSDN